MEKQNRVLLFKIIISSALLLAVFIIDYNIDLPIWGSLLIYLVPYLIIGYDVLLEAVEHIFKGKIFNENFLMSIATIGALLIGFLPGAHKEFLEAVFVMLFFKVGELFEEIAEGKTEKSILSLMNIRPDIANVEREGLSSINPEDVQIGEIIVVKPGERIPLDGIIVEGNSNIDTVALTGESAPREVKEQDEVYSGCININGVLRIKTTKLFRESTASKIIELINDASKNKSKSEDFITKFAKYYTPIVVLFAFVLAFLPPIVLNDYSILPIWLHRALTFLVVSCPCALVISVPLSFVCGIGGASKKGILIKGSNYIEKLSKIKTVVFDKTGTLTKGVFKVTAIHPEIYNSDQVLHYAAHVERYSTHPIGLSLREAYKDEDDNCNIKDVTEYIGKGIKALVNGKTVYVGNDKLMDYLGIEYKKCDHMGTIIHVSIDDEYAGHIVISDEIKEDAKIGIEKLKEEGVNKTVMLTGDSENVASRIAFELKIDEYKSELFPADKVEYVSNLEEHFAFIGDGINDAPVLARSDIGISMGGVGSDAAIEASDVVITDDKISKIGLSIKIAKKTLKIVKQNILFALTIKLSILVLAIFGLAPMYLAIFADVGVTILAILNASRALKE